MRAMPLLFPAAGGWAAPPAGAIEIPPAAPREFGTPGVGVVPGPGFPDPGLTGANPMTPTRPLAGVGVGVGFVGPGFAAAWRLPAPTTRIVLAMESFSE